MFAVLYPDHSNPYTSYSSLKSLQVPKLCFYPVQPKQTDGDRAVIVENQSSTQGPLMEYIACLFHTDCLFKEDKAQPYWSTNVSIHFYSMVNDLSKFGKIVFWALFACFPAQATNFLKR